MEKALIEKKIEEMIEWAKIMVSEEIEYNFEGYNYQERLKHIEITKAKIYGMNAAMIFVTGNTRLELNHMTEKLMDFAFNQGEYKK